MIRQDRATQALRERFPKARTLKNIKNSLSYYRKEIKHMSKVEQDVFEDRYKDLFKYLRSNAPELLPEVENFESDFVDMDENNDGDGDE